MGLFDDILGAATTMALPVAQQAIRILSPVPVDLRGTLAEQAVVIREEDLNSAIARHLEKSRSRLASVTVSLRPGNELGVAARPQMMGLPMPAVTADLRLKCFTIDRGDGLAVFEFLGPLALRTDGLLEQVLAALIRAALGHLLQPAWLGQIAPEHIQVDGSKIVVDLKNGALRPLYETSLSDAVGLPIPKVGQLKAIDVMRIYGARTEAGRLMIDMRFDFGG